MPFPRPAGRATTVPPRLGACALALVGLTGTSNLAQTNDIIWVMIAISAAGAIVTFSFLVYSLWRFRDPNVKGRRYG
jgi:hypothetical protein